MLVLKSRPRLFAKLFGCRLSLCCLTIQGRLLKGVILGYLDRRGWDRLCSNFNCRGRFCLRDDLVNIQFRIENLELSFDVLESICWALLEVGNIGIS